MRFRILLLLIPLALTNVATADQITASGTPDRATHYTVNACQTSGCISVSIDQAMGYIECDGPDTLLTAEYLDILICSSYPTAAEEITETQEGLCPSESPELTLKRIDPTEQLAGL